MDAVFAVEDREKNSQYSVQTMGRLSSKPSRTPVRIITHKGGLFIAQPRVHDGSSKYCRIDPSHISPSLFSVGLATFRALFLPLVLAGGISAALVFKRVPKDLRFFDANVTLEAVSAAVIQTPAEPAAEAIVEPEPAAIVRLAAASVNEMEQGANEATLAEIAEKKSLIKFLAGMIAMTRPSVHDVGKLSREIVEISSRRNVDPFYVAAIISVESQFHDKARSSVGATGLMQLMPATAKIVAREKGIEKPISLTDTRYNIALGVDYIISMEKRYRGNRFLALSAYNWGPGNVDRASRGLSQIPGSVRRYAATIIERSVNWSRHFRKAQESASALDQVAAQESRDNKTL
jgi:soluble lytic murein transglycosylase-like protein